MITIVTGDATNPIGEGRKIVAHVCNSKGGWGKGFVLALSKRWTEPESCYRQRRGSLLLGEVIYTDWVQDIKGEPLIKIANMVCQNGYASKKKPCALHYTALEMCLHSVYYEASKVGASVHMPRIGCGLAGGKWEEVFVFIEDACNKFNIRTTIYEFQP